MNAKRTEEPTDRLTRLCDAMTRALDDHAECHGDERCIVFLRDGDEGGIQWHGYEDDADVIADLIVLMKALFEENGHSLQFAPMPGRDS